jgi:phospholipid/cholesterol/gamma-HCH transport system substrate-binding protein
METRARYILIGLFTLAVVAIGFGFVFWLNNAGGLRERIAYRVSFESPVPGLRSGSTVLFNGIRVGEVTELRLVPEHPKSVIATILVERSTPLRADTQVGVETQGFMGAPSVMLRGGDTGSAALTASATLKADPAASQDTMQTVRGAVHKLDLILSDNAEPLRDTIANLRTFTGALARNSDRIDGLLDALERLGGGGPTKAPPASFDLNAAHGFPGVGKPPAGQLVVLDPTTYALFETQKILVPGDAGSSIAVADAQWSDSIPRLLQSKIIQSFENAGVVRVNRPTEGLAADHQLLIDIRSFRINAEAASIAAEVEFAAKLIGAGGRIVDARVFRATSPAKSLDAPAAAGALNVAFARAVTDLVLWTSAAI